MKFVEFINKKHIERYEYLKDLNILEGVKSFASSRTDKLTSKMWILPDGTAKNISGWHYQWILDNRDKLQEKYGLDISHLPAEYYANTGKETEIRIAAIKSGFIRVNYEIRNGNLTLEGLASKYTKKIKDTVFMLILDNINDIGTININLFNDAVSSIVVNKSIPLFKYGKDEKFDALDGVI
jgi:hypothetical protein